MSSHYNNGFPVRTAFKVIGIGFLVLLVIGMVCACIWTDQVRAFLYGAPDTSTYSDSSDAALDSQFADPTPTPSTDALPVDLVAKMSSKQRQTIASRDLNKSLTNLTGTVYAPNKATTKDGVATVAVGNLMNGCEVVITHDVNDLDGLYGVEVTLSATDTADAVTVATRQHASVKGVNYLLGAANDQCASQSGN